MNRHSDTGTIDQCSRNRAPGRLGVGLGAVLLIAGCTANYGPSAPASVASPPSAPVGAATAPASTRVDLVEPSFSDPTAITNPLFPRVGITQVIQLGAEGEEQLRFEVTQLTETKPIEWNGQSVETRVTHFMAYADGRILEVARDFYAQADDGSVWYFGEDVFNYENGVVANNEGTWLAGRDGPPGMIMPADPRVGDVYRPENIPDLVFEEVTVMSTGETVDGPRGPVSGAVLVQEHLMDGTIEDKVFAPGYGEFRAEVVSLDELYGVAFAAPTDAAGGPVPGELTTLSNGAAELRATQSPQDSDAMATTFDAMTAAWNRYREGVTSERLVSQMTDALEGLGTAIDAQDSADAGQAAIAVSHATLDLELAFRQIADVDVDRLKTWARQLQIDTAAGDPALVLGDVATLEAIWERVGHAIDPAGGEVIGAILVDLRAAADSGNLEGIPEIVATLAEALDGLVPAAQ